MEAPLLYKPKQATYFSKKFCCLACCCVIILGVLVLLAIVGLLLIYNPITSVKINDLPITDLSSPMVTVSADVSSWFPLVHYNWTFPDGTYSTEESPSWDATNIANSHEVSQGKIPNIRLKVSSVMGLSQNAQPMQFYYYSAVTIQNYTLIATCTETTQFNQSVVIQLSPAPSNYSVGSVMEVPRECGMIRMITDIIQVDSTMAMVNTSAVALNDVFEELSVNGTIAGGPEPTDSSRVMKSGGVSSAISWLLEPGTLSVSNTATAQVSITPTFVFSPQFNYQFLISGWSVKIVSFELSGIISMGISATTIITSETSLAVNIPLGEIKGEPFFIPVGAIQIPVEPAMVAEASVTYSFQVSETVNAAAAFSVTASISAGYSSENGFFSSHSINPVYSITPPNTITSCGFSVQAAIRPALELKVFGYYPSLSLGPEAGIKLSASSAPEKSASTAQQQRVYSPLEVSSNETSSVSNYSLFYSSTDFQNSAYSALAIADSDDQTSCSCDDVPVDENPGLVSAKLVGVETPWLLELSVLPFLSDSWDFGTSKDTEPWWSECYTVAPSACESGCCGPPIPTTFNGQIQANIINSWGGVTYVMVNNIAQFDSCDVWFSDPLPGRYCLRITSLPTAGTPNGSCSMTLYMSQCVSPLQYVFKFVLGIPTIDWRCSYSCSTDVTVTMSGDGNQLTFNMPPLVLSVFTLAPNQSPATAATNSDTQYCPYN